VDVHGPGLHEGIDGPDAGGHFFDAEGRGDVVVGARFETQNLVRIVSPGRAQ